MRRACSTFLQRGWLVQVKVDQTCTSLCRPASRTGVPSGSQGCSARATTPYPGRALAAREPCSYHSVAGRPRSPQAGWRARREVLQREAGPPRMRPAALGSVLDRCQVVGLADAAFGVADGAEDQERVGVAMLAFAAQGAKRRVCRRLLAGPWRALGGRGVAHGSHNAWWGCF